MDDDNPDTEFEDAQQQTQDRPNGPRIRVIPTAKKVAAQRRRLRLEDRPRAQSAGAAMDDVPDAIVPVPEAAAADNFYFVGRGRSPPRRAFIKDATIAAQQAKAHQERVQFALLRGQARAEHMNRIREQLQAHQLETEAAAGAIQAVRNEHMRSATRSLSSLSSLSSASSASSSASSASAASRTPRRRQNNFQDNADAALDAAIGAMENDNAVARKLRAINAQRDADRKAKDAQEARMAADMNLFRRGNVVASISSGSGQPAVVPDGGWQNHSVRHKPGRLAVEDMRAESRPRSPEQQAQLALAIFGDQAPIMSGNRPKRQLSPRIGPVEVLEPVPEQRPRKRITAKSAPPPERRGMMSGSSTDDVVTQHHGTLPQDPNKVPLADRQRLSLIFNKANKNRKLTAAEQELFNMYKDKKFNRRQNPF
jgi:hypothetical protein